MKNSIKTIHKKIIISLLSIICFSVMVYAQTGEEKPKDESYIQWLITPSVPLVDLDIAGLTKYDSLPAGAEIAGGIFPLLDWAATCWPTGSEDSKQKISVNFKSSPLSSKTVVVLGDFKMVEDPESKKEKLRAKFEVIDNQIRPGERPNRLIVINAMPESDLLFSFDKNAVPIVVKEFQVIEKANLPKQVTCFAKLGNNVIELPFGFLDDFKTSLIVFYLKKSKPEFKAINLF